MQFDLLYNPNDLTSGDPVGGNALSDHLIGSAEVTPGLRRVLIFSFSNAPLTNGVLVYIPFSISPAAADHNEPMTFSNVIVDLPSSQVIPSSQTNGILAIAIAPHFSAIFPTNNGSAIHLELTGTAGRNYTIQSTTNLSQSVWTAASTNVAGGGLLEFEDMVIPGSPARFYRAVVAP